MRQLFSILILFCSLACRAYDFTTSITNYGAIGDCSNTLWVTCVSNSATITLTSNLITSAYVGETAELFGAGTPTSATQNQDLITTVASVNANGSNVTLTLPALQTLTSTWVTFGHDNMTNFQQAINDCAGYTNALITVPTGNFLCMADAHDAIGSPIGWPFAMKLRMGGVHIIGQGTNSVLIDQAAWYLTNSYCYRGMLFQIQNPCTNNNYPVSFENMIMDGGVYVGYTTNHGYPASTSGGFGWDGTHDAFMLESANNGPPNTQTIVYPTVNNCTFRNWRGEVLKSTDSSTNANWSILNCTFSNNNASCDNIQTSMHESNNYFCNDDFWGENQGVGGYQTNICLYEHCFLTNCSGFAITAGFYTAPKVVFQFDEIWLTNNANNGTFVQVSHVPNVYIISNIIHGVGFAEETGINTGIATVSQQGWADNSNEVFQANILDGAIAGFYALGGASDTNQAEEVLVKGNIATNLTGNLGTVGGYGYCSNILVTGNSGNWIGFNQLSGQWPQDYGDNTWIQHFDNSDYSSGNTNDIIGWNTTAELTYSVKAATVYYLTNPPYATHLASGVVYTFHNSSGNPAPVWVNPSQFVLLSNGATLTNWWDGWGWNTNFPSWLTPVKTLGVFK